MKIAFLIHRFAIDGGGVERAAFTLARGLMAEGHEIHACARTFGEIPADVRTHAVLDRSIFPGGRHVAFARGCRNLLKKESFDLVHSFTRTYRHDILRLGGGTHAEYLQQMASERSAPAAWFTRFNPKERAILRLEREGFQKGNYRRIVAVSHRVKKEVIRHYGVPDEDIIVIHNGIDPERFHPGYREEARKEIAAELKLGDHPIYLYCGSGFVRKGLKYAVEAAAKAGTGAVLLVAGNGDTTPYRNQAERLGLTVHFLGARNDIERIYAAADLLLHPTLYDPFPNVCLEAMGCGTPVVTTQVAGPSEVITDGTDSFVIPHGSDVDAIVDRIRSGARPRRPRQGGTPPPLAGSRR